MATIVDDENIIKLLGIESLPDERKTALVERISELVQKRLLLRLLDSLVGSDQDELKILLDRGDQAALQGFLVNKAPDLATWAADEVIKIKKEPQSPASGIA